MNRCWTDSMALESFSLKVLKTVNLIQERVERERSKHKLGFGDCIALSIRTLLELALSVIRQT